MIALSIAGFDPSGGAGILADVKTFHSLGIYPTAVITALTAQNVNSVAGVEPVNTPFVSKQIDMIMEGAEIQHAKTGMLYSAEMVEMVARQVQKYQLKLVVDPVLVAGSGGVLSQDDLVESLRKYLLPVAELTTPNVHEAEALTGVEIVNEDDACEAAIKLGKICPTVVTGGHLKGRDIFYKDSLNFIEGEIIKSTNTHGSGCTYSAAITAYLAQGMDLLESIRKASDFTKKAIKHGGYGTLNQMWQHSL
ncbi:bifunctional hydroxymethylpyrimidine kinase/phosphomethylpyrimidine kinase [Methanobacterium sp. BAmetb5]|jgi:hydroxymethylpyrimidine/phosphomethylpyrimidine kinase|uniref:bifunctional hydroxymethylpyrimidine kinase/phosphomethylpyrimidine kinase n=1 Tax=Methanobacterium sp. BAmetb5 TaxID=2025351 RepID=UPI000E8B0ACD|nr:bifunctional hydroxymethylpyrimidine kinase/phosphomethylpyrimidine kinase [Methanobacterium sp. BAmetb5]AXV39000.1 MAG: bifunctional hydroxymethylpyrimidine kinase/phosphomethylpyrimidine kinase [Methanobacterium sp. BAmetb5]